MEVKPNLCMVLFCARSYEVNVVSHIHAYARFASLKRILRTLWIHERFIEISSSIHKPTISLLRLVIASRGSIRPLAPGLVPSRPIADLTESLATLRAHVFQKSASSLGPWLTICSRGYVRREPLENQIHGLGASPRLFRSRHLISDPHVAGETPGHCGARLSFRFSEGDF